jgi:methyl-accepting chemotaxis protein-2 (aspartate sensor receptor)
VEKIAQQADGNHGKARAAQAAATGRASSTLRTSISRFKL